MTQLMQLPSTQLQLLMIMQSKFNGIIINRDIVIISYVQAYIMM